MSIIPLLVVLLAIGGIGFAAYGVNGFLRVRGVVSRRLSGMAGTTEVRPPTPEREQLSLEDDILKRFEDLVTPKNPQELQRIRNWLMTAGYRRPSSVRVYFACKAGLGLGFAVLSALFFPIVLNGYPIALIAVIIVSLTILGYASPSLWISRQRERRQEAAELGFPDMLDMLLVCIGAGHGLDQALRRVANEFKKMNPTLSEELTIVNDELRAGKARPAVMRDFSERLGVDDITNFTTVLKQSDEFGVSIADTLRIYAGEMRNKRVMRAEEKANMMPVKLAMGSILFTVPPTMLVMAGPSLVLMIRSLTNMGGQ